MKIQFTKLSALSPFFMFITTSTAPKVIIRRIIAVLNLPKSNSKLIIKARAIVKSMTGNANFPTPIPDLTTVSKDIDTLETAETAAQSRAAGTVAARDAAKETVLKDLRALTAYVQSVADNNVADSEAIITSAGLDVKKQGAINKQDFTVKPGVLSGSVILIAKGTGNRTSHDWQSSTDGNNWSPLPSTIQAKTTVEGLTPVTVMFFRHRVISKDGPGAWSQPENIVIS